MISAAQSVQVAVMEDLPSGGEEAPEELEAPGNAEDSEERLQSHLWSEAPCQSVGSQ